MTDIPHSSEDLKQLYEVRFAGKSAYRQKMWRILAAFFSKWIPANGSVLDLGCGYCEYINASGCRQKYGMDLNPDAANLASPDVKVLLQDCSQSWQVDSGSLDAVFTSNFFEHLPTKQSLEMTLRQAYRALKPGGRLVAMGPNIKYLAGAYWDFFDHYLPLTELSLVEVLTKTGFTIEHTWPRFLPYRMSHGPLYPLWMLSLFLRIPLAWRMFGKQFLIVARKA